MASKSKDQLENELTEALALVEKLTAENTALKAAQTSGPSVHADAPLTEDELDLRRRIRAGLTPAQAREAQAAQKAHDAALAAASAN